MMMGATNYGYDYNSGYDNYDDNYKGLCYCMSFLSPFFLFYTDCILVTVAQKTAPMFAYYIKTHVLLNADMI